MNNYQQLIGTTLDKIEAIKGEVIFYFGVNTVTVLHSDYAICDMTAIGHSVVEVNISKSQQTIVFDNGLVFRYERVIDELAKAFKEEIKLADILDWYAMSNRCPRLEEIVEEMKEILDSPITVGQREQALVKALTDSFSSLPVCKCGAS